MDVQAMCKHYQAVFNRSTDVLEWVAHDLQHMKLSDIEMDKALTDIKQYLGINDD